MSYYGTKKLVSVRVDAQKYAKIREILDKKNVGRYKWNAFTFSDIVDLAMDDYIDRN